MARRVENYDSQDSNRDDDARFQAELQEKRKRAEEERKSKKGWAVVKLAGLALTGILGYASFFTVDQTEQAVVTRLGRPVEVILNPLDRSDKEERTKQLKEDYAKQGIGIGEGAGLYFKIPIIESVTKFDRRILRWNGYPENMPTKDKRYIWVDPTARAYIEDPLQHLRRGGTDAQFHGRLDEVVDSAVGTAVRTHDLIEIVRTDNREMKFTEPELAKTIDISVVKLGRAKIVNQITAQVKETCKEYGIGIHQTEGVLIKGLVYVDSVKASVEDRMISERNRIAAKYTSEGKGEADNIMGQKEREVKRIQSEAYRTSEEIKGRADGESTRIYAEGFVNEIRNKEGAVTGTEKMVGLNTDPEFYGFVRSLQLYEDALAKGGKTRLIIGTSNPLLKNLTGQDYSKTPAK